jgi:hypothetical protein
VVRFFPFTELALSITRSFAPLRMTRSEGFRVRMTKEKGSQGQKGITNSM